MNNEGEFTHQWGDGTYAFRLTVKGLLELEEKCSSPFAVIFNRVVSGQFGVNDISETIRLGLIGGGLPSAKAFTLVDRYIFPIAENVNIAKMVLAAVMFGFEAAPPKKEEAAPETQDPPNTNVSMPPPSQNQHSSSGSNLMSLDEFHSGSWWRQ